MPNPYALGYKALKRHQERSNPVLRLLTLLSLLTLVLVAFSSLLGDTREAKACYSYAGAITSAPELSGLSFTTHYDRKAGTCIIENRDTGQMIPLAYREHLD